MASSDVTVSSLKSLCARFTGPVTGVGGEAYFPVLGDAVVAIRVPFREVTVDGAPLYLKIKKTINIYITQLFVVMFTARMDNLT